MTRTRQLIVVLAIVAVIGVAALIQQATQDVLNTVSGGGGPNMTSEP